MSVEENDTDINEDDAMVALELSIRAQKRAVVKTKETVKENLLLKRALAVAHAKNSKLKLHILENEKLARRDISPLAAVDNSVGVVTPSQQNRRTAGSSNRSPTPVANEASILNHVCLMAGCTYKSKARYGNMSHHFKRNHANHRSKYKTVYMKKT